jgi:peptide deformylase
MTKIIHIPHPTLRKKATEVEHDVIAIKKLQDDLGWALLNARNPKGVGLAAPQINVSQTVFATHFNSQLRFYINPQIEKISDRLSLGEEPEEPDLEGCLSIPSLYGPVPRARWVELSFFELHHEQLLRKKERFEDFFARVILHEFDHLLGRLFLDYSIEYDLPVYEDGNKNKPLDPSLIETIVTSTWQKKSE